MGSSQSNRPAWVFTESENLLRGNSVPHNFKLALLSDKALQKYIAAQLKTEGLNQDGNSAQALLCTLTATCMAWALLPGQGTSPPEPAVLMYKRERTATASQKNAQMQSDIT